MKLYGSVTSPFVRHCRIAMTQGGLEWELVETDVVQAATKSPTKKVPFLEDGNVRLTDSSSILKYAREKSGHPFFADIMDYELFCMANTAIDASINTFLLKNDGLGPDDSKYLSRQGQRVESVLDSLDEAIDADNIQLSDGVLRVACLLEWGLFRSRFDLASRPNLRAVLDVANKDPIFVSTAIPK